MKLYYLVDGKMSVHITRETTLSKLERIDFIMFETLWQVYLRMTSCQIPAHVIKAEIMKMAIQADAARENLLNGKIESMISPPKFKRSVFNEFYSGQSRPTSPINKKIEIPLPKGFGDPSATQSMVRVRSGRKPAPGTESTTLRNTIWPSDGRTGWYKISPDHKHSQLARFGAYSRVDDISDFDEKGIKIRFRLDAFKILYYADDILLQQTLKAEDSFKNQPSSLNKTFSEMSNNLIARVDFVNRYFTSQASRLISTLAKKYLGKTVRILESQEIFGERALESKVARSASVLSLTACR